MTDTFRQLSLVLFACLLSACVSGPEQQTAEDVSKAEKLLAAGVSRYDAHDYRTAYDYFNKALYQYRSIDHPEGIVSSSINIARVLHASNQISLSKSWIKKARQLNQDYLPDNHIELSHHIRLLDASIDIAENDTADAEQKLSRLLEENISSGIRLSALQLRTRIAFTTNNDENIWLKRYADAVDSGGKTAQQHKARLLRFQAALDKDKHDQYLQSALKIYRSITHQPGMAATLSEWAQFDISENKYPQAEDKLLRALLIRLELRDRPKVGSLLTQLETVYDQTGDTEKGKDAAYWKNKLGEPGFVQWQAIIKDLEDFPE